jgi:cardiolipin synthase A/B
MFSPRNLWQFPLFSAGLTIGGFLLALVLLARLLRSNRPPSSTLAWALVIVLLPWVGVPLYLMFGGRKISRMAARKRKVYRPEALPIAGQAVSPAERVLRSFGVPAATPGNLVEVVTSGEEAYSRLMALIDSARCSIHITTFLLANDEVGLAIVARLARRAAEGVEVKLLLDAAGCWRLRRRVLAPLIEAGGAVAWFMPVLRLPLRGRANLRNHRKIVVIDGVEALAGGMNLAEEYMGPTPMLNRWRDVSVVVRGPAAADLDDLFVSDWTFANGQPAPPANPPPTPDPPEAAPLPDGVSVQVVASGPDVEGDPLYESLISLLFAARERIWVVTPYFVPDEILVRALDLAARRGVDVRVVIPQHSNHLSADLARVGYLRQIHEAGGIVLRYRPGMLHGKVIVVDQDLAVVGSANMDMRSLFLNYEVALFLYGPSQIQETTAWMESILPFCRAGVPRRTWLLELAENVVRLLSPLL